MPFTKYTRAETEYASDETIIPAEVWSGDITLLKDAYDLVQSSSSVVLLETRVDADDGLHKDYIQTIQAEAMLHLTPPSPPLATNATEKEVSDDNYWRLWCAHEHVEWHPDRIIDGGFGYLKSLNDGKCITPGITYGVGSKASRKKFNEFRRHKPMDKHHKIMAVLKECGSHNKKKSMVLNIGCVQRMKSLKLGAIRSRTPTSVGMQGVLSVANGKGVVNETRQTMLWNDVVEQLSVSQSSVKAIRQYIMEHMSDIAKENLESMCKPGHSCKESAKKKFQTLLHTEGVKKNMNETEALP